MSGDLDDEYALDETDESVHSYLVPPSMTGDDSWLSMARPFDLLATMAKSWMLALISIVTGAILAVEKAVGGVNQALEDHVTSVTEAVFTSPASIQKSAVGTAEASVESMGLGALPASAVVAMALFLVIGIIIALAVGD